MRIEAPDLEVRDAIKETGGEDLKLCYQCGLCTGVCPWNLVRPSPFLVNRHVRAAQLGLTELESEENWLCTTCGACASRCPRGVKIIDIWRAIRRIAVEWGNVPSTLRTALTSMGTVGNPWGEAREKRADWAKDLELKAFAPDCEYLLFPCCTPAYDPRARRMAQKTAKILKKAGVDFGILGVEENCCGESARKAGDEELFRTLASKNISLFKEKGVKKIIAISPHCFWTFRNEYPEFDGRFEVVHYSQILLQLVREGRIELKKEIKRRVAYHDPCYLGRHSGIYDEPRELLRSIPGLELVELPDAREDSLCCGGGGGRMWIETPKGERFSDLRIEQALEVGAEIIATACPYCIINFEDSILVLGKENEIAARDLADLIWEAMGEE